MGANDKLTTLRIVSTPGIRGLPASDANIYPFGLEVQCCGCGRKLMAVQSVTLKAGVDDFPEATLVVAAVEVDAELRVHSLCINTPAEPAKGE